MTLASCVKRLSQGKNPFYLPVPTPVANWMSKMQNKRGVKKFGSATTAELVTLVDTAHAKATRLWTAFPRKGGIKRRRCPPWAPTRWLRL